MKILKIILTFIIQLVFLALTSNTLSVYAAIPECHLNIDVAKGNPPEIETRDTIAYWVGPSAVQKQITFTADISSIAKRGYPNLKFSFPGTWCDPGGKLDSSNNTLSVTLLANTGDLQNLLCRSAYTLGYHKVDIQSGDQIVCTTQGYTFISTPECSSITAEPIAPGIGDSNSKWSITAKGLKQRMRWDCPLSDIPIVGGVVAKGCASTQIITDPVTLKVAPVDGHVERTIEVPHYETWTGAFNSITDKIDKLSAGWYEAHAVSWGSSDIMCITKFNVGEVGATPLPTPSYTPTPSPIPTTKPGEPTYTPAPPFRIPSAKPLCDQLEVRYQAACKTCLGRKPNGGMWTAIGCIPINLEDLIKDYIFKTGVGIAGGIAFLYFLYGAFLILTSTGNPEKIEEAKQIIMSSLSGIILILFSIFLLRVIGVDILALPGFG